MVDTELLSSDANPEKLLGQIGAALLSISFLTSVPLLFMSGRLPEHVARIFAHFFIATTMLVVGLFAVLSWDAVFPDRQDVLVLAPLPVSSKMIFLAKVSAIGAGLGVSVGALNGVSGLLWPWLFMHTGSGFFGPLRAMMSFWLTLSTAAMFVFGSALTIEGAAARLLPRQMFLRVSGILQVATFCLLVSVYVLEPSLESNVALGSAANHRLLEWLPSYWFWGMFQRMNGAASEMPGVVWLANRAWAAAGLAVAGAAATVMLSYLRGIERISEEPDIAPGRGAISWRLGCASQRAVLSFVLKTISRSRKHRMILSSYMGTGFGVMLILLRPAMGRRGGVAVALLAASALMLCTAAAAMRSVFSMPMMLQANWIFRVAALGPAERMLKGVRDSFLLLAMVPLWSGFAVALFMVLPWRAAAAHLVWLGMLGMMLADLCMGGFRRIPFTCSYRPGRGNLQFAFWGALVLLPLTLVSARYEWMWLQSTRGQVMVGLALVPPAVALRWWTTRRLRGAGELLFEDVEEPTVVSLDLVVDAVAQAGVAV